MIKSFDVATGDDIKNKLSNKKKEMMRQIQAIVRKGVNKD